MKANQEEKVSSDEVHVMGESEGSFDDGLGNQLNGETGSPVPPSGSSTSSSDLETVYKKGRSVAMKERQPCYLVVKNFSYKVKHKKETKVILENINFANAPGSFLAIMGPSGSGKTTLLNAIARRTRGIEEGAILMNGSELSNTDLQRSGLLSYIMTSDCHLGFLTLHETLMYSARLKLPHVSDQERLDRVESLLHALGLHSVRDVRVGGVWSKGLSNGEMRRLSIAVELIDNPDMILLDEPTSGLDSQKAYTLIPLLRSLAKDSHKNVIVTIHQPSSAVFRHFDNVLFLANGRVFYWGPAKSVMTYLNSRMNTIGREPYTKSCNPADFVLDLISPMIVPTLVESTSVDSLEETVPELMARHWDDSEYRLTSEQLTSWCDDFRNSEIFRLNWDETAKYPSTYVFAEREKAATGIRKRCSDFVVLYERFSINSIRNPMESIVLTGCATLLGVLLGVLFYQSVSPPDFNPSSSFQYFHDWANYVLSDDHPVVKAWAEDYTPLGENGLPLPIAPNFNTYLNNETVPSQTYKKGYYEIGQDGLPKMDADRNPVLDEIIKASPSVEYNFDDFPIQIPSTIDEMVTLTDCVRNQLLNVKSTDYTHDFDIMTRYKYWNFPPLPTDENATADEKTFTNDIRSAMEVMYRMLVLADFAKNKISHQDMPDYSMNDSADMWINTGKGKQPMLSPQKLGLQYWVKIMACYGEELNSLLQCFNFPALPDIRDQMLMEFINLDASCSRFPDASTTQSPSTAVKTRLLKDVYERMVAVPARVIADATKMGKTLDSEKDFQGRVNTAINELKSMMEDLTHCPYDVCESLDTIFKDVKPDLMSGVVMPLFVAFHTGGTLLFLGTQTIFASFDAIISFQQQRVLFNRETNNSLYNPSSFFLAKMCAALPFNYFHTTSLFLVFYFLVGYELRAFGRLFLMFLTTCWAAYGFNYMFAAMTKTLHVAVILVPLSIILMMITTGFFIRESAFPAWLGWIKYLSLSRWSFHSCCLIYFPPGEMWGGVIPNDIVLSLLGVSSKTSVSLCLGILGLMGFVWRAIAFICLKYFHRDVGLQS